MISWAYNIECDVLDVITHSNEQNYLQVRNVELIVDAQVILLACDIVHGLPCLLTRFISRCGYQPIFGHFIACWISSPKTEWNGNEKQFTKSLPITPIGTKRRWYYYHNIRVEPVENDMQLRSFKSNTISNYNNWLTWNATENFVYKMLCQSSTTTFFFSCVEEWCYAIRCLYDSHGKLQFIIGDRTKWIFYPFVNQPGLSYTTDTHPDIINSKNAINF